MIWVIRSTAGHVVAIVQAAETAEAIVKASGGLLVARSAGATWSKAGKGAK